MNNTLHVEIQGQGETLVLVHGWGFHGGIWDDLAGQLAKHFRVVRPDLPGHGHSGLPVGDYELDGIVDSLVEAAGGPAVWIGWSLGSVFALRAAMLHPQQVRGVVTLAGTPCFTARKGWKHGVMGQLIDRFGEELTDDWQATLQRFIALQGQGCDPRLLRRVSAVMNERLPSPEGLRGALGILRNQDLRGDLGMIRCPVLAINGVRDNLVPLAGAKRWLNEVDDGRLMAFQDAGHVPFLSHPEDIVRAIHGFASYRPAPVRLDTWAMEMPLQLEAG